MPKSASAVGRAFGKTFVAALIFGGGACGGSVGAYVLSDVMAGLAGERFDAVLQTKTVTDSKVFVRTHSATTLYLNVDKFLYAYADRAKNLGDLPSDTDSAVTVRAWRQQEPFASVLIGKQALYYPDFGVVASEEENASILAHELGHGLQTAAWNTEESSRNQEEYPTFWGAVTGTQLAIEVDAWRRAHAIYAVDESIEDAALQTYRSARGGLAGGAVAGFGFGAAVVSLGLMWFQPKWTRAQRVAERRRRRVWGNFGRVVYKN